jgi:hypothetical protein
LQSFLFLLGFVAQNPGIAIVVYVVVPTIELAHRIRPLAL